MVNLLKSQMVLVLQTLDTDELGGEVVEIVKFQESSRWDDPEDRSSHSATEIQLSLEMWQDMGTPDRITVSVVPGDTLNEEG